MSKREEFWARVNEKGESLNQQTKGLLGQMSENAMGFEGNRMRRILTASKTLLNEGKSKECLQQIGKCEEF